MTSNQKRVLISGFIIMLCLGIIYVWSIFQIPVMQYYKWSVSEASLTFSIMLVLFVLGSIIGGRIQDIKGPRPVVLSGGLLLAGGIFLTSIIPVSLSWLVYITYGIAAGFGSGSGYAAILACILKWFPNKTGIASGLMVCAYGASAIIIGPIANYLVQVFGLISTLQIISICFLSIVVCFVWFIKNPKSDTVPVHSVNQEVTERREYTVSETLRTKQIYLILVCMMLITPAYIILNPLIKVFAFSKGLTDSMAVLCVMVSGISFALGGFVFPSLSDIKGRKFSIYMMFYITLAASVCIIVLPNFLYITLVALIAFCYGGPAGVFPALIADYYGSKNVGAVFGFVLIGFAAAALISPILAKSIQGSNPETEFVMIIPIIMCIAGIFVLRKIVPPKFSDNHARRKSF